MKSRALVVMCGLVASLCAPADQYGKLLYEVSGDGTVAITNSMVGIKGALTIPSTIDGARVVEISKGAFQGRTGLTSVVIPSSVTTIATDAFKDCAGLTVMKFADLRAEVLLGKTALQDSEVETLTLPRGIQIKDKSFYDSDLRTVAFTGMEPPGATGLLDTALNAVNDENKLKVKVSKVLIPYAADLGLWTNSLPLFLSRKGVVARSNPRLWIEPSEGGTVSVVSGSRTVADAGTVSKGSKITYSCKPAAGYVFAKSTFQGEDSFLSKRTVVVPGADMTLSATFVTREAEKEAFDGMIAVMQADGLLNQDNASALAVVRVGEKDINCVQGCVGQCLWAELRGSEALLSQLKTAQVGLPAGLSVIYDKGAYFLVGVPSSTVDFAKAPAYLTLSTASGFSARLRLNLQVLAAATVRLPDCLCGQTNAFTAVDVPEFKDYEGFSPVSVPVGFAWDFASETPVTFLPTAPALHKVAMARRVEQFGKTFVEQKYLEVKAVNRTSQHVNEAFAGVPEELVSDAGVKLTQSVSAWFADAKTTASVSGLPAGLAFNLKKLLISGTPTKAGTFVVTLKKTIRKKSVVQRFLWTIEPQDASFVVEVQPDAKNLSFAADANKATILAGAAGQTLGSAVIAEMPLAKVTATGLPKGLSLVKQADGTYALSGRATKVGTYLVLYTATAPGGSVQYRRIEYTVAAHPLKGSYRGYVATPDVGVGLSSLTVDELGRASLTLTEGSLKSVVKNVYATTEDWFGGLSPSEGRFAYEFTLPANKTRKLPARTCRLVYGTALQADGCVVKYLGEGTNACAIVSSGRGATPQVRCWPYLTADLLASEGYNAKGVSVDSAYAYGYDYVAAEKGLGLYLTALGTPASRTVKVTGRLPAGKSFSASTVAVALDREDGASVARDETLAFAPVLVKDTDGTCYMITLPLAEGDFGKDSAKVQVWSGTEFADGASGVHSVRTFELPASVLEFVQSISEGNATTVLQSSLVEVPLDFSVPGKVKVDGGTPLAVAYGRTTGFVKFSFKRGKASCVFEGVLLDDGESGVVRGVLSRTTDGKKFSYARAVITSR